MSRKHEGSKQMDATTLVVEIALIGSRPALIRYAVTFIVPPVAGLVAEAVARVF